MSEPVYDQLLRAGMLASLGEENVYRSTRYLGRAVQEAWEDGQAWLSETGNGFKAESWSSGENRMSRSQAAVR